MVEFVTDREKELNESHISRTTQSLLSAAVHDTEKYLRQETLSVVYFPSLLICQQSQL